MEWQPGGMSEDVEDRRDDSGGGGGGGGFGFGGGGGGIGGGGIGIIGFVLLLIISAVTGRNFLGGFLHGGSSSGQPVRQTQPAGAPRAHNAAEDRDAQLVSWVLDDVQGTWTKIFKAKNRDYTHAKLVLFRGSTYSGCGTAQAATGPFYCPADQKVYIDLDFWDELKHFGGSTADFAQAYVIAHELGHHVQNLLGTERKVTRLEQQDAGQKNHLSVDLELQADCYAGVWAHSAKERGKVDPGDIEAALSAATAVGDDHLQKMAGRAVSPETWTHGSSAQRTSWFNKGFEGGDPANCNTFGGAAQQ